MATSRLAVGLMLVVGAARPAWASDPLHPGPTPERSRQFFDMARWPHGAPNAWYARMPGQSRPGPGGEALVPGVDVDLGGTNEPASAINRFNSNQVAYASAYDIRVSVDGGQSFAPAVQATQPAGHFWCGDSSLGYDSQGRLFWAYLGCTGSGLDIIFAQVDPTTGATLPGYPVSVTESPLVNLPGSLGHSHDKEWLAIDTNPASPFRDRLYLSWTEFIAGGTRVLSTWSNDLGLTWQPVVEVSSSAEGFVWPVHNAVAANGDYYVGYHSQTGWSTWNLPDGVSGQQIVVRSTDGGRSFPRKSIVYGPGQADITFNVQTQGGSIPGTLFWLQGSVQPYLLPDPKLPNRLYVVSVDDPDNDHANADHSRIYIKQSDDFGQTWSAARRVDSGPAGTFQVMPTAAIDPDTGSVIVTWYDNRNGQRNSRGNFLLDLFATTAPDGSSPFEPDVQINDRSFDPDPGAPIRWGGPPDTTRIGEYNGLGVASCYSLPVWCGNTSTGGVPDGQQSVSDVAVSGSSAGTVGNGLRASKAVGDVALEWPPAAVTPPLFNVHRGIDKLEIDKTAYLATQQNPAPLATGAWSDPGVVAGPPGELYLYELWGSDCAGNSVIR